MLYICAKSTKAAPALRKIPGELYRTHYKDCRLPKESVSMGSIAGPGGVPAVGRGGTGWEASGIYQELECFTCDRLVEEMIGLKENKDEDV